MVHCLLLMLHRHYTLACQAPLHWPALSSGTCQASCLCAFAASILPAWNLLSYTNPLPTAWLSVIRRSSQKSHFQRDLPWPVKWLSASSPSPDNSYIPTAGICNYLKVTSFFMISLCSINPHHEVSFRESRSKSVFFKAVSPVLKTMPDT